MNSLGPKAVSQSITVTTAGEKKKKFVVERFPVAAPPLMNSLTVPSNSMQSPVEKSSHVPF